MKTKIKVLFLLLFFSSFTLIKYYLLFFHEGDKNIKVILKDTKEILGELNPSLSSVEYKLLSKKKQESYHNARIGIVTDDFFKIGVNKYYYQNYESKYPTSTNFLKYGVTCDILYFEKDGKRYITSLLLSRSITKEKEMVLPFGLFSFTDSSKKYYNKEADFNYNAIYTSSTKVRSKITGKLLDGKSRLEVLSKLNSNTLDETIYLVKGEFGGEDLYVSEIVIGQLFEDIKEKYGVYIDESKKIEEEKIKEIGRVKKILLSGEKSEVEQIFNEIGIKYIENKSIYYYLGSMDTYYKSLENKLAANYLEDFNLENR